MKKLILLASIVFSIFFTVYGADYEKDNPQDTLKIYYLDEFVITTSVKETNQLRNMPTAVSVVSPNQLQNTQIKSLPDLSSYIPNFFIPSYGSKVSTPIYIRGIGARLGSQTVSLYVDNVPSFNPSAFDFEFQDIQRVEVLRGAQGTLYGRNAIGGIVNLYTLSPLTYQGTRLTLSGGNYGQFSVMGSNYSKLSNNFGLSTAAYYKRDDGYFINNYTNEKVDNSENAGGRIKLEWQVSPDFKALLFGNYDYVSGGAFPYMHVDSTESSFNEPSSYDRHLFTNGLSLDWLRNGFSIHSTTGFQYLKDDMKMDQDYTSKSVFSINQMQEQHSLSQEFTVKSEIGKKYNWVLGAFGFYDKKVIDTPVAIKEDGMVAMQGHLDKAIEVMGAPLRIVYANDRIDLPGIYTKPSKGAALFHQSTFNDLFGVDGLSATVGLRFDYEHTSMDFSTESNGGDVNLEFNIPNRPMPTVFVEADTLIEGSFSRDFGQFLPKFALKYDFSPTSMIYVSTSKGYKTGGYNEQIFSEVLQNALAESIMQNSMSGMPPGMFPGGGASDSDSEVITLEDMLSYDPETSWTYEVGGRYEMFNRKLSLIYAIFYSKVDDIQIIKLTRQGTSGRTVENAGKSESKGFELSMKYSPIKNLSFYGDYGFADARFANYEASDDISYSGNYIPFAPRHTLSIGIGFVHNFGYRSFIDRFNANIQYTGVGKIYWTESNKTRPTDSDKGVELYQPFYGLMNGSVSVEKGAFSLELWGKNLLGTDYNSFLFEAEDMTTGNINQFVQRGYPTRMGVTLRCTFDR